MPALNRSRTMAEEPASTERPAQPSRAAAIREHAGSDSAIGMLMSVLLLIVVVGAMYLFSLTATDTDPKDSAIAEAASDVGKAASKVGDAAQKAAKKVKPD
jgi:hypothetical protein